ncbi:MAG: WG repeat-containing protein [Bacteroidota bacterium]
MKIFPFLFFFLSLPFVLKAQLKASKFMFLQAPGERTEAHGIVSSNDQYGIEHPDDYLKTEFIYEQLYFLSQQQLYLARKDKLWGLVDKGGEIVIPFQYRTFKKTVQQYYVVEKENKFGILNTDLETTIPVQYEDLHCYKLDLCLAKKDGKWGAIDGTGKTIIPHEYRNIQYSKEGTFLAAIAYKKWGVINSANEVVMPFQFGDLRHLGNNIYLGKEGRSWKMIDEKGIKISELKIDQVQVGSTEKFVIFRSGRKWGLLGKNGQILLEAEYDRLFWFLREEQEQVIIAKKEGKHGLFSIDRGWIEPIQYDNIVRAQSEQLLYVLTLDQKQGLKENGERTIFDIEYQSIRNFRIEKQSFFEIKNQAGLIGFFDGAGQVIVPMEYASIKKLIFPTGELNGLLLFEKENTAAVFDVKEGKFVIEEETEIKHLEYNSFAVRKDQWRLVVLDSQVESEKVYDEISVFKDKTNDYYGQTPTQFYKVKKLQNTGEKKLKATYGLIDAKGNEVLPPEFSSFKFAHENLIICSKEKQCGLYDLKQNAFLGLNYESGYSTPDGMVVSAKVAGKSAPQYGFLDKTGQLLIPVQYDRLEQQSKYIKAVSNGKYGLLDLAGKVQLPFEFAGLSVRSDLKMIFFKQQGKWGIKDQDGKSILDPILDEPRLEKENPIPFQREGKYGYLNYLAQEIVPCQYDYAEPFYERMAIIGKDQLFGVINLKHERVLPLAYDTIVRRSFDENFIVAKGKAGDASRKWGLFNGQGENLLPVVYDTIWWEYPEKNYVVVQNGQYGLFGRKGNELIAPEYEQLSVFDQMIHAWKNGKQGLFNLRGQALIPCQYDAIHSTFDHEGNYIVKLDGQYGLYNISSQVKTPIVYEAANHLDGRAVQFKQGNQWKLWILSKQQMLEGAYDSLAVFGRSHFRAKTASGWGIIDENGKILLPFGYDQIGPLRSRFGRFPKDMASITKGGLQGYVLEDGRFFVAPKYQEIRAFQEGMARFQLNDFWGFVDEKGKEVIGAKYESVSPFEHGLSEVQLKGKTFYIDKSGKCQKNCED